MGLPSYKEIIELVKLGSTLEAQERVMELRQAALDLQDENLELRARVSELEARIRQLESVDGEPCPRCKKRAYVLKTSEPDPIFGDLGGARRTYECTACGFTEQTVHEG